MHWYHTMEVVELQTPSRENGVDYETETRYRREGAQFVMELGNKLGLRYLTMATGIVFFHRFYMFHSFKEFSRWVTGATCLFLAGKVEETPKKCRDILKVAQQSLPDKRFKAFGDNPREEVMICERILLQTIKFDLQTNHPYQFLIKYGKLLKGEKSKINELVQKAWIFINDSLSTTLCLIYKPQVIAIAVLVLAVKMSNQNIKDLMQKPRVEWWKTFFTDAKEAHLDDICKELMNMYEKKPPRRRFPNKHKDSKKKKEPNTPGSPQAKRQKVSGTSDVKTNDESASKPAVSAATNLSTNNSTTEKNPPLSTTTTKATTCVATAKTTKITTVVTTQQQQLQQLKYQQQQLQQQLKQHQQQKDDNKPPLPKTPAPTNTPLPPPTPTLSQPPLPTQTAPTVAAPETPKQTPQKTSAATQPFLLDHMSSFFQSNFTNFAPNPPPQQQQQQQQQQPVQQPQYQPPSFIPPLMGAAFEQTPPPQLPKQQFQPANNFKQQPQQQGGYQTPNNNKNTRYQTPNKPLSYKANKPDFQTPTYPPKNNAYQNNQQNKNNSYQTPNKSYQQNQYTPNNISNTNFNNSQQAHNNFAPSPLQNFLSPQQQQQQSQQPAGQRFPPNNENFNQNFQNFSPALPQQSAPFTPGVRMPQHVPPPFPNAPWIGNPTTPPANAGNKPPHWMT